MRVKSVEAVKKARSWHATACTQGQFASQREWKNSRHVNAAPSPQVFGVHKQFDMTSIGNIEPQSCLLRTERWLRPGCRPRMDVFDVSEGVSRRVCCNSKIIKACTRLKSPNNQSGHVHEHSKFLMP